MGDYLTDTPGKPSWLNADYRTAARTAPNDYRATRTLALLAVGA